MCFSATASYSAAVVLVTSGVYAAQLAWRIRSPYWLFALTPLMFGIQQAVEGRVWQLVGEAAAIPYALAFHLFSHFIWLWWLPLASYLVEPQQRRRQLFLVVALCGAVLGGMVYFSLLLNPEWMRVEVEHQHLIYSYVVPQHARISLGIPPSLVYALIILVPLFLSSHRELRTFGALIAISVVVASAAYGYALVSTWCFFSAVLSLYCVRMVRRHAAVIALLDKPAAL